MYIKRRYILTIITIIKNDKASNNKADSLDICTTGGSLNADELQNKIATSVRRIFLC